MRRLLLLETRFRELNNAYRLAGPQIHPGQNLSRVMPIGPSDRRWRHHPGAETITPAALRRPVPGFRPRNWRGRSLLTTPRGGDSSRLNVGESVLKPARLSW